MHLKFDQFNVVDFQEEAVKRQAQLIADAVANGGAASIHIPEVGATYTVGNANRFGMELIVAGLPEETAKLIITCTENAFAQTMSEDGNIKLVNVSAAETQIASLLPTLAEAASEHRLELPSKIRLNMLDYASLTRALQVEVGTLTEEFVQIVYSFSPVEGAAGGERVTRPNQVLFKKKKPKRRRLLTAR